MSNLTYGYGALALGQILPALLSCLRGDEDTFFSSPTRTLTNASRVDESFAGVEDVGRRVVRLQPAIEMLRNDLRTGTSRPESKESRDGKIHSRLHASFLVDDETTIGGSLEFGVVGIEGGLLAETHDCVLWLRGNRK